ncbi:hypothetical protein [Breoghania sp.]|uniref:hypothetical protein n=1 Tax=Breoghania sp. TaxID=2065378 RepID=UPI00260A6028|nr:hypothetical protein [Breoghania sp.]MDJ0932185.1 hypothetical protein [Breoghania sp.]
MATTRLLIAALGGEGGGVLTNWLVAAASAQGLKAQATSVPSVAQRTGARPTISISKSPMRPTAPASPSSR